MLTSSLSKTRPRTKPRPRLPVGLGAILLFALTLTSSPAWSQLQPGSPWPISGGTNQNSRITTGPDVTTLTAKWTVPYDSSGNVVVAADGTIYLGANGLSAMNPDGTVSWSYPIGQPVSDAVALDGTICVSTVNEPSGTGDIYAFNPNGTLKWHDGTYPQSSRIIGLGSDGTIYLYGGFTQTGTSLLALYPNGSQKWAVSLPYEVIGAALDSTGTIYLDQYIETENGSAYGVLDSYSSSGALNWQVTLPTYSNRAPVIGPNGMLYIGTQTTFYAFDASGNPKWSIQSYNQPQPLGCGPDGTVYMAGNQDATDGADFMFVALNPDGTTKWSYHPPTEPPGGNIMVGIAITQDNQVYAACQNSYVYSINSGGEVTGQVFVNSSLFQLAVGTNGVLYVSGSYDIYAIGQPSNVAVASLTVSPNEVMPGFSTTATVTLSSPAGTLGDAVNISSSSSDVSFPQVVSIPSGSKSATFAITATNIASTETVTLSASSGGVKKSATLTIDVIQVASISLNPSTIGGLGTSTGTVTLYSPALTGGFPVTLTPSAEGYVNMPASVTVPAGATSATFNITGTSLHSTTVDLGIIASYGTAGAEAILTITTESVSGITLSPAKIGGVGTSTATVKLSAPAPAGGWQVNLLAGASGYVNMPTSITIPAGATSATFTIAGTKQRGTTINLGIIARDETSSREAILTIQGDLVTSLTLNPASVAPGGGSTGTVTISTAAPAGGWIIHLTVGAPAYVGVPASVTIPAGATSATFSITTKATDPSTQVLVIGSDGNSQASAKLTIT